MTKAAIGRVLITWIAALCAGCYLDVSAGASRTVGGVRGYGWEIAMTGGIGFEPADKRLAPKIVRPSVGADISMARTHASDGKFGSQGVSYHGRLDVAVSVEKAESEADLTRMHPGMGDLSGIRSATRVVLDYGLGTNEELRFTSPDYPMTYTSRSTVHSFYAGIAKEYDYQGKVQISYSIGPHITYMPNDFVGTATATGIQVHNSFWFFPVWEPRKTGSLLDHYTPSDPIRQGPEAPGDKLCNDSQGNARKCPGT